MSNKKLLLGGLIVGAVTIGSLAWSAVKAANNQPAPQPTPAQEQKTCGCGNTGCQASQNKTGQTGCGCRNKANQAQKANFIDANNNGICDRAE